MSEDDDGSDGDDNNNDNYDDDTPVGLFPSVKIKLSPSML